MASRFVEYRDTAGPLYGVWLSGLEDIWAVGWNGEILRKDTQGWRRLY